MFKLGRLLERRVVEVGEVRGGRVGWLRNRPLRRGMRWMGVEGSERDLLRRVGGVLKLVQAGAEGVR